MASIFRVLGEFSTVVCHFFHTSIVQQSCLSLVASVHSFFRAASGLTVVTWFEHYSCQKFCCVAHFTFSKSFHGAKWEDLRSFFKVLSGDGSWLACEMKALVAVFSLLAVLSALKPVFTCAEETVSDGICLEYSIVRKKLEGCLSPSGKHAGHTGSMAAWLWMRNSWCWAFGSSYRRLDGESQ